MPWGAAAVVASAAIGAYATSSAADTQAQAAENAANTSAGAQKYATDVQYKMFEKNLELQKPWQEAGTTAVNRLAAGLAPGGEFGTKFSATNWQQDPGYAFRLAEGQKALERSAAARGGLISGNALKAAERYGQEMGSQEYQNAFNRYYREREAMLNPLQSLAGLGQSSAQSLGGAAANTGSNIGNLAMTNAANQGNALMAAGQARASAYQGYGSAAGQALGGIGNYLRNYNTGSNWVNQYDSTGAMPDASGQGSVQGNSDYYYDL